MKRQRGSRSEVIFGAVSAVILGAAMPALAANLLANPGFEAPTTDPPGTSSNCTAWDFGGTDMQRATFQNHTPGGNWCLWAKTFEDFPFSPDGGAHQNVPITAGASYDLTAQMYFETNYPTCAANTLMGLTFQDAGGSTVGSPTFLTILPAQPGLPTGAWTPFTVSAVAPAGATQVQVFFGWDGGSPGLQQIGAFFDDADLEGVGTPPSSTWAVNASGDWNHSDNWANLQAPNAVGAEANFMDVITSPHTVFTDTPVVVGTMRFNNANTYVITGAGSLTMDVASGSAQIVVSQGSHKINLPLFLSDNTVANVSGGATLTIADPLTLVGGTTLTKTGAGAMDIISLVNTTGPAFMSTQAGTLNAYFDVGTNTTVNPSGGTTNFHATQHVAAVNIGTGATVNLISGGDKVVVTKSLAITGSGKLDLNDNDAIIDYTGPVGTQVNDIRNHLKNGRLVTGAGTATTRLGYGDNAVLHKSNFAGQVVDTSSILIKYTYAGDADLDGDADGVDIGTWATNFTGELGGVGSSVWTQGDWDYDGDVDGVDAGLWAQAFTGELGGGGLGSIVVNDSTIAPGAAAILRGMGITVVPEPASLAVGTAGLLILGMRRRREA